MGKQFVTQGVQPLPKKFKRPDPPKCPFCHFARDVEPSPDAAHIVRKGGHLETIPGWWCASCCLMWVVEK